MTAHGARIRSTAATRWRRAAFVLPAALALLAGLDAALMLLGLRVSITVDRLPDVHGMPVRPPSAHAGRYPFVSHSMVDAERGAHGILTVTG